MKKLQASLKKVSSDLIKASKEIDKVAAKLGAQASTRPTKISAAKRPTAAATVLSVIKKSRKGVGIAAIRQATGYNDQKLYNVVSRLKKQGKIRSVSRGVYVKI